MGKGKKYVTSNFSFFHSVFKRLVPGASKGVIVWVWVKFKILCLGRKTMSKFDLRFWFPPSSFSDAVDGCYYDYQQCHTSSSRYNSNHQYDVSSLCDCRIKNSIVPLTLSQMTYFRLFQTGRVCRREFQTDANGRKFSKPEENTQWKMEKLLNSSNFSFSHSVFKILVLQTCQSLCFLWEQVNNWTNYRPFQFESTCR